MGPRTRGRCRKVSRRTPGRFRTRVITDGVVPSLHVDYKKTRIKQYHKEGQALRTETTINDTRDFAIGRRIENLPELRKIGFAANRRLLDEAQEKNDQRFHQPSGKIPKNYRFAEAHSLGSPQRISVHLLR
jgi:hypothetical protein